MKTNPNDPIGKSSQVSFNAQGRLNETHFDGMTIRQYYAGLALQGLLAGRKTDLSAQTLAKQSIMAADALIDELNLTDSQA
jgi:hypothetical protein